MVRRRTIQKEILALFSFREWGMVRSFMVSDLGS
ncbi:unnamed protein product [Arabidopsis halleri]